MTFPSTLDTDFGTVVDNIDDVAATHINTLRRAVEGIEAKLGIDGSTVKSSLDYKANNFFVAATKLYFYANTPPLGWTIDSPTDKVLAIRGGSYGATGGALVGSFSILAANVSPHAIPGYRSTYNDIANFANLSSTVKFCSAPTGLAGSAFNLTPTGSSDGLYRPYAAVGIIAYNSGFIQS